MAEKFSYNYSAEKNEEIIRIREKYTIKNDKENDIFVKIKKLDSKIENSAKMAGIFWGIFFTLVFGSGLSICLTQINNISFVCGIILGIVGITGMAFSKIIAKWAFEKQKAKYGAEIIKLTDQIIGKK